MFVPEYEKPGEGYFTFGKSLKAQANPCLDNESVKSFWNGFCCQSGELDSALTDEFIFAAGKAEKPELNGNQYAVNVESTGFCVAADSKKGLINGFVTLLHQIKAESITEDDAVFKIRCGSFAEKPLVNNQMVHFCVFPETELWELDRFIRLCAALKYSHIVIEFWGMLRFDCLKELGWKHAFTKEQIRPLIKTANELGIEIIPMFNHWGHASLSRVQHGKHVVLDQNPKLQPLFSDDGWTWQIEKPEVNELLRKVRNELIELCGEGQYFHLGCDEAYNFEITHENHTVLTDYLNSISNELAVEGRRPIVWGDMLVSKRDTFNKNNSYTASCKSEELERCLLNDLSRNIIIADWQYCVKEAPVETALIFKEAGFDTILCPWDNASGLHSTEPCVNTAVDYELYGLMHTTWHTLSKGMCDVTKAAFGIWHGFGQNPPLPRSFFATNTAKLLRRVYPVNGDYEKAGWSRAQISDINL